MAELPIPPGMGVPLVDQTTFRLPAPMVAAHKGIDFAGVETEEVVNTGRLSEAELNNTFVQFRNFDGSAVAAGSVVVVTLTEDGTDIHDITVEEA